MTLAMPPQKAARGLAGNPVFLLKQRWEAGGGCRWPPCQLEGGLGPEIEPGVGSPGQRQRWAWCWFGSEVAPGSASTHGGRGREPLPGPAGAGTRACIPWAAPQGVLCPQAYNTHPPSRHATHGQAHVPPVYMDKHAQHNWHTSMLGPDRWTCTRTHTHVHTGHHDLVRTHPYSTRAHKHTGTHTRTQRQGVGSVVLRSQRLGRRGPSALGRVSRPHWAPKAPLQAA